MDARNAATASLSSDCQVTRCNGSRGGISVPARSAICSRKALRSSLRSCSALRVSNSNAAGCRNGRISARPSSPITAAAPSSARSVSAARAVVTRSWARSVFSAPADAATCAAPKSVSAGDPSSRTTTVVASRCPCEMPSSWRSARTRHAPLMRATSISSAPSEPSVRALASSTRTASPCWVSPASSAGSTATRPRSAASVTKASCSTCWSRPTRTRFAPRCQIAYQVAATSWPSWASRPNTLTTSGRPSEVDARVSATPRGCSAASRVAVASTPSSLSTSVIWSSVSRPPGEPKSRCTTAADPNPIRNPARTPIGSAAPSATLDTMPIAISQRPISRRGRARSGDAVTITAVATAMRVAT